MILTPSEMTAAEQGAFQRGIDAADLMNQAGEGIAAVVHNFFKNQGSVSSMLAKVTMEAMLWLQHLF